MRLFFLVLAAAFLVGGLLFGALNSAPVAVDLYFTHFELSAGVALLASAFVGASLAGVILLFTVVWPLRRRVNKLLRQESAAAAPDS
jgi:lipopolysaccharide assembly protein A